MFWLFGYRTFTMSFRYTRSLAGHENEWYRLISLLILPAGRTKRAAGWF